MISISAIIGNLTNVGANYALIFGSEGIPALGLPGIPGVPALGLNGAAIGTVIGTAVEVAIPMTIFLGRRMHAELGTRDAWTPQARPIGDLFRIGWPAAVQYGNELICWSIFMTVLVGKFGENHMTAGWIALSYMHLSFMPAIGFSVAATSLVGKYVGAGQPDIAVHREHDCASRLAMVYMTTCAGVIFWVFRSAPCRRVHRRRCLARSRQSVDHCASGLRPDGLRRAVPDARRDRAWSTAEP